MQSKNRFRNNRRGADSDNDAVDSRDWSERFKTIVRGKQDPVWFIEEILHQNMFPRQREIVRSFYRDRYDVSAEKIKTLVVVAGMRGGKTAMASMLMAYSLFDAITIPDPAKHFGLMRNQPIFLTCMATSEKLASDGVFQNMCNMVEGSEWMMTWGDLRIKSDRIDCDNKHVHAQVLGSWLNTGVGRSNIWMGFDELDLFENTTGKRGAWGVYSRMYKSTATFGLDGKVIAISSPQSPTGIMMTLYNDIIRDNARQGIATTHAEAYLIPTWEMNPNYTKEGLMAEYKNDMTTFYRDFACQPEIAGGLEFPEGVRLTKMTNVLTDRSVISTSIPRVLCIDPAVKNDGFGMACGYNNVNGDPVVDGAIRFVKREGKAYIIPSEIKAYVDSIMMRLNIGAFVFDTWMFPELVEHMDTQYGITAEKHIVRKEDYDRWRSLQEIGKVDHPVTVVFDEDVEREATQLLSLDGATPKCDHPFNGSKDVADCVANCIWYLTSHEMDIRKPQIVAMVAF